MQSRKNSLTERDRATSIVPDLNTLHTIAVNEAISGIYIETDAVIGSELMELHCMSIAAEEEQQGNSPCGLHLDLQNLEEVPERTLSPGIRTKSRSNTLYSLYGSASATPREDVVIGAEIMELFCLAASSSPTQMSPSSVSAVGSCKESPKANQHRFENVM